jgi:hypothetical protein
MEVSDDPHTSAILRPGKQCPVPSVQEVGWAPEPIWMLWKISIAPARNQTLTDQLSSMLSSHYTNLAIPEYGMHLVISVWCLLGPW